MSTYTRIAAALLVAFLLSALGWKSYTLGEKSVQAKWDKQTTRITEEALKLSEENRAKEKELKQSVQNAKAKYAKQVKINADLSATLDSSLRDFNAENIGAAGSDTSASAGTHGTGGLERELLGNCAGALAGLAKEADRLENKVVGLQDYAKSTGLAK